MWIRLLVAMEVLFSSLWWFGYKSCQLHRRVLGLHLFIRTCGLWIEENLHCRFCCTCRWKVTKVFQFSIYQVHFPSPIWSSLTDTWPVRTWDSQVSHNAAAVAESTCVQVWTSKYALLIFRRLSLTTVNWEMANVFLRTPDPSLTSNTSYRWAAMNFRSY